MCGIFCSFSKDVISELAALNGYRGSHSYSVYVVGDDDAYRSFGEFDITQVPDEGYKICHVQAPTTEARDFDYIHPALHHSGSYTRLLWHNGIIKDFDVTRLQKKQKTYERWDTMLLLEELNDGDWLDNLSQINGSFACIFYENDYVYVFRNEISPLFYDDNLNFSSVKFAGSRPLPPNNVFFLDLENRRLIDMRFQFTTKENPYYMPEGA